MIEVNLTQGEREAMMRIEGHAGYGEKGKDIVCAATSILAQTLERRLLEAGALLEAAPREQEAVWQIRFWMDTPAAREAVRTVMTGFGMLASQYPRHVAVGRPP